MYFLNKMHSSVYNAIYEFLLITAMLFQARQTRLVEL